jgi:mono/diheme cytochrome c family protein
MPEENTLSEYPTGTRWIAAIGTVLCLCSLTFVVLNATAQTEPPSGTDANRLAALMDTGEALYGTNCSECHQDGGVGKALAGDSRLANADLVIKQLLHGSSNGDMPEFGSTLDDGQVAAVATYVRNSWGNQFGIVLAENVKKLREQTPPDSAGAAH